MMMKTVEDDDELSFDMEDTMTRFQASQLRVCVAVLSMLLAIAKKGVLALNHDHQEQPHDHQHELEEENHLYGFLSWSSILPVIYRDLQTLVIEWGAALCPPFDAEDVLSHVESVERMGQLCLTHFMAQPRLSLNRVHELATGKVAFLKTVEEMRTRLSVHEDGDV